MVDAGYYTTVMNEVGSSRRRDVPPKMGPRIPQPWPFRHLAKAAAFKKAAWPNIHYVPNEKLNSEEEEAGPSHLNIVVYFL
jgi:hypothetical protein